jgi:SAM-dependent methyltransferase
LVQQLKLNLGPVFHVETVTGMVASLPPLDRFDTAIYIDVLEHIEDDRAELSAVAKHIRPGGHIIVLSPAFQALYSPFDEAIGHYRRYSRSSLLRCAPPGFSLMRVEYLDSLGAILSFGNRTLLRRHYPTLVQILFWDRWVVPLSRLTDRLTGFGIGRTILGVWQIPE